jgi:hypothetical protein
MNRVLTQAIASEVQLFQSIEQQENFLFYYVLYLLEYSPEESRRDHAARTSRNFQNSRPDGN